jgi:hypothetical protein
LTNKLCQENKRAEQEIILSGSPALSGYWNGLNIRIFEYSAKQRQPEVSAN